MPMPVFLFLLPCRFFLGGFLAVTMLAVLAVVVRPTRTWIVTEVFWK